MINITHSVACDQLLRSAISMKRNERRYSFSQILTKSDHCNLCDVHFSLLVLSIENNWQSMFKSSYRRFSLSSHFFSTLFFFHRWFLRSKGNDYKRIALISLSDTVAIAFFRNKSSYNWSDEKHACFLLNWRLWREQCVSFLN